MLFKCRGCEAKDAEIAHLRAELERFHQHLERAQQRLTEIAVPGIEKRIASATQPIREAPKRAVPLVASSFPGYGPRPARPAYDVQESGE